MGMTSTFLFISLKLNNFILLSWLYFHAELLPLLPGLFIVGGFIIITLAYVSWRKYRGEKKEKQKKRDKLVD